MRGTFTYLQVQEMSEQVSSAPESRRKSDGRSENQSATRATYANVILNIEIGDFASSSLPSSSLRNLFGSRQPKMPMCSLVLLVACIISGQFAY